VGADLDRTGRLKFLSAVPAFTSWLPPLAMEVPVVVPPETSCSPALVRVIETVVPPASTVCNRPLVTASLLTVAPEETTSKRFFCRQRARVHRDTHPVHQGLDIVVGILGVAELRES